MQVSSRWKVFRPFFFFFDVAILPSLGTSENVRQKQILDRRIRAINAMQCGTAGLHTFGSESETHRTRPIYRDVKVRTLAAKKQ